MRVCVCTIKATKSYSHEMNQLNKLSDVPVSLYGTYHKNHVRTRFSNKIHHKHLPKEMKIIRMCSFVMSPYLCDATVFVTIVKKLAVACCAWF